MPTEQHREHADYVTIIGADMADIMRQFQAQGLAAAYSIVHKVGRHLFTLVEGEAAEQLFAGRRMIAATFARRADA